MHSVCRVIAFCGLLLNILAPNILAPNIGYGQPPKPSAAQLEAMERFARHPAARVSWSNEVDRIEAGRAHAVVTAMVVEDASQPPKRMRGIRIDLVDGDVKDQVYTSEEHLARLIKALNEIASGLPAHLARTPAGSNGCYGSGEFWLQEGHALSASACTSAGWSGLSVGTGNHVTFRFTGLNPAAFSAAIARARDELKQH